MALFDNMTLTAMGRDHLTTLLTEGGKLTFLGLALGDGVLSGETPESMTALKSEIKRIPLDSHTRDGDLIILTASVSTASIQADFYHREMGIIAAGVDGSPLLLAYGNAGEKYDFIPTTGTNADITKKIETSLSVSGLQTVFRDLASHDYMTVVGFYTRIEQILPGMLGDFYTQHGFLEAVNKAETAADKANDSRNEAETARNDAADSAAEAKEAARETQAIVQNVSEEVAEAQQKAEEALNLAGQVSGNLEQHSNDLAAHTSLFEVKADKADLDAYLRSDDLGDLLPESIPVGTILWSAASIPMTGWLVCNGASLSRTAYAALFAVIGTVYGGSGTLFLLPDLRGRFVRGWDNGAGLDSGRTFGSKQSDAIRNIMGALTHIYPVGAAHPAGYSGAIQWRIEGGDVSTVLKGSENPSGHGGILFDASAEVPTARENRPVNMSLLPIIKY